MSVLDSVTAIMLPEWTDATALAVGRIVLAIAIGTATLTLRRLTRRGVRRALTSARVSPEARLVIDRIVQVGILIAGAAWISDVYGLQLGALGTLLGITGVAVGLAMQDVLKQLVAGMYLMIERPFTLGDHVALPAGHGIIRRIELLATLVDLADGGVVVVPNAWFLANAVIARRPGSWITLRVRVIIRESNAEIANADSLVAAVSDCVVRGAISIRNEPIHVRVSGWTADGPIVTTSIAVTERETAVDSLAWAMRERFGQDLIEFNEL